MTALQILGFITCLWAMAFVAGLGLMMGAWAGIHAGTWAFGAINIGRGDLRVVVKSNEADA